MSKDKDVVGTSEKFGIGTKQELTKWLNDCKSVEDQGDELRRIQSGDKKRDFANKVTSSGNLDSMHSQMPSDSSVPVLFTPPTLYSLASGSDASTFVARPLHLSSLENRETSANQTSGCSRASDFDHVLLRDIGYETRRQLGLHLDPEHTNVANWKSVADRFNFSYLEILNFNEHQHRTEKMLIEATVKCYTITLGDLCRILEDLGRGDVITEMEPYFARELTRSRRDVPGTRFGFQSSSGPSSYGRQLYSPPFLPPPPFQTPSIPVQQPVASQRCPVVQDETISTTCNSNDADMANVTENSSCPILPMHFSFASSGNLVSTQSFDAFLLYDVADKKFILQEFLPKVQNEAGVKLFMLSRDSPLGSGVYDFQLKMMMDNCRKVVVIQSDEFLRSPLNMWSLSIAISLDPAAKKRKIIPVNYKKVTEPSILDGLCICDRTKMLEDSWFWNNIVRSLKQSG